MGKHIAYPKCNWRPSAEDRWWYTCGHTWNTFSTHGVCPAYSKAWQETECHACYHWSHNDDDLTVAEYLNRQQRILQPILLTVLFLLVTSIHVRVLASDTPVTILCGQDYIDSEVLPDPFPGAYFTAVWESENSGYAFERISQTRRDTFHAPLTEAQTRAFFFPLISPDGKRIVFRPHWVTTKLLVWDIATGETVEFDLGKPIADYLSEEQWEFAPSTVADRLGWRDAHHLVIRDFGYLETAPPVLEVELEVTDDPLQIIPNPELAQLSASLQNRDYNAGSTQQLGSADQQYQAVLVSEKVGFARTNQLSIYASGESAPIFTTKSNDDVVIKARVAWVDNHLFYLEGRAGAYLESLVQIDVGDKPVRNEYLNTALEAAFGTLEIIGTAFYSEYILSNDGQSLGLAVVKPSEDETHTSDSTWQPPDSPELVITDPNMTPAGSYFIKYTPSTGEIIAVCEANTAFKDGSNAFFSPDDQYLVVRNIDGVFAFDFKTGNRYRLPGHLVVGWIPSGTNLVLPAS